jgi:CRISPR/Cas system CMR-associated protein Cmr5 small subunit
MATLDQDRAALAFKHVSELGGDANKDAATKYASIAHKLPALLASAGLCQALHFVGTRGDDQRKLVDHLAMQLERTDPAITSAEQLLARARDADLALYLRLTEEAIACAAWYRRMVQAVLKIEAANADRD